MARTRFSVVIECEPSTCGPCDHVTEKGHIPVARCELFNVELHCTMGFVVRCDECLKAEVHAKKAKG